MVSWLVLGIGSPGDAAKWNWESWEMCAMPRVSAADCAVKALLSEIDDQ